MHELQGEDADPSPSSATAALLQVNSTDPGLHEYEGSDQVFRGSLDDSTNVQARNRGEGNT